MPVRCAGEAAHVFRGRKKEDICVLASQGIQVHVQRNPDKQPILFQSTSHYLSGLSWEGSWLSNQSVADLGEEGPGFPPPPPN